MDNELSPLLQLRRAARRARVARVVAALVAVCVLSACGSTADLPAASFTSARLEALLEQRFAGDRTGACVAAAVIETQAVPHISKAIVCAAGRSARPIDARTAFEIGSVSKTMTGMLLADLIARGQLSLDDPLERHLPPGTKVPAFAGQPIRLRHLTTHTSGLPSLPARFPAANPDDPYADLTEEQLFASLGDVTLEVAPGTRFEYSNFAVMVLSAVLARTAGQDFESLLRERLFAPLGMTNAFVTAAHQPPGTAVAKGHLPGGQPTSAWNISVNLAGVGGVRASLDDMIRYAEAALGHGPNPTVARIEESQRLIDPEAPQPMGMGWGHIRVGTRLLLGHEGGTGGFSASVTVDRAAGRAVVLLSDTSLSNLGGLQSVAFHVLGVLPTLEGPRRPLAPPPELLGALVGRYYIDDYQLGATLVARDGTLFIHPDGQPEFELGHDSHGDFYPLAFDALLTPVRRSGGMTFLWTQGGGTASARRALPAGAMVMQPFPAVPNAADYVGQYPLLPDFVLTVTSEGQRLFVQGTGQPRFELEAVDLDVFVVDSVGAELTFERDRTGRVEAVTLRQAGRRLRAPRQ